MNGYKGDRDMMTPLLTDRRPQRQIPSRFEQELRKLDSESPFVSTGISNQRHEWVMLLNESSRNSNVFKGEQFRLRHFLLKYFV